MERTQSLGPYESQFNEILSKALDKTMFATLTAPATPDTEFSIGHGLGFMPIGFLLISKDRACDVYLSTTARTTSVIYLKCTTGNAVLRIMIF